MSFLHGVIRCFMARCMPQNNHFYNKKKKKHFSNGKPELSVLFEHPPPTHTQTHTNAHTLTRFANINQILQYALYKGLHNKHN